jgi:LPS-assembly protein
MKILFFVFILIFQFLFDSSSKAANLISTSNMTISADSSSLDSEKSTQELSGHVQIIYNDQHLVADRAIVNFRSKTLEAVGNVVLTNTNATVGGQRVTIDLESNTGIIYDGYVQSGPVFFEGSMLYKYNDKEYLAENARYTTCMNCPESWSFSGKFIRAELGGYAFIKNPILKIGGVPILPMPYLIVPLKSDRQTGLLTPEFGRSNIEGFRIGEGLFWAINRSNDATFTLVNYELRGLKGLVNYRYALSEHSEGSLDMAGIQDRIFPNDSRMLTFANPTDQMSYLDRWFLHYNHYFELPENFVSRVQLNNASDYQYPKDFPLESTINGDSTMENRISISKSENDIFWMVDSSYYINMLQSNPLGGNDEAVHRLPEININHALSRINETNFHYLWNFDLTNFARSSGFSFDTMNSAYAPNIDRHLLAHDHSGNPALCTGDNWEKLSNCYPYHNASFDSSKDLIRTGQRLDFSFAIDHQEQVGPIDITPKITYRETDYNFAIGDSFATRQYAQFDLSTRTILNRVYETSIDGEKIKHEFEPEISATFIPWIYQPPHPFFADTAGKSPFTEQDSLSDINLNSPYGIQFDYFDRNYDQKIIHYGFSNRLIRKTYENGKPTYKQFLNWSIFQAYDFYQSEDLHTNEPWSNISSDLSLTLNKIIIYQHLEHYPYKLVTESSNKVRYLLNDADFVQLAYDLSYNMVPGQPLDASTRVEQVSVSFKKSMKYLDLLGKVIFDLNKTALNKDQDVNSYGVGAQVRLPGECWYLRFIQYRPTGGTENFAFSFDFSFDGKKKPGLPESLLDTFSF